MQLDFDLLRVARPLIVPLALIAGTALMLAAGPALPLSLATIGPALPWLTLLTGTGLSVLYNRGRSFIAFVSLLAAYAGIEFCASLGPQGFPERAVYTAVTLLVPANILFALVYAERGVYQHRNYRWWLIAAAEIVAVAWVASAGRNPLSGTFWQDLLQHWLFSAPPTPLAGRIMLTAAFVAAVWRAWPVPPAVAPRPLDVGMASLVAAFFIACEWFGTPRAFSAFVTTAGIMMLVALMQESHRLAYYDELTSLPGRRALEERLPGLGPQCAMGMIDIDHFKKFNDTHGHDIGDQVLKLVAARLAKVTGGGTAYRYGGEEFAVLFPDKTLDDALRALEELRAAIESYPMKVRSDDRPRDSQSGSQRRAPPTGDATGTEKTLSVTVSIGAAERRDRRNASHTLRAADKALYRAKSAGRNRVSR
jgi:diguanylate cyclase (GGDEF)-like protein